MSKPIETILFKGQYGIFALTDGKVRYRRVGRPRWVDVPAYPPFHAKRLCVVNNFKEKNHA